MKIAEIEKNVENTFRNFSEGTFIYDLLASYGIPKASISRLQSGDYNKSKNSEEILWKKKLLFRVERERDLHLVVDELKSNGAIAKHHPRFVVVTDFQTLLAMDSKNGDTLDIPLNELTRHYDFFLPWAGMEKAQVQGEHLADRKAAERMGRLYDLILKDNPPKTDTERHALNVFFSRLLFCFFAEDTGLFSQTQFTNSLASHTAEDGSDLKSYLEQLFKVLNLSKRGRIPQFLADFPYVNGGLFSTAYPAPMFSRESRKIIIECGSLNWKAINPDIFGSMMQAVVHTSQRGNLGIHYTSVANIMKVIKPLFLDEICAELEKAGNDHVRLKSLLARLCRLQIFDPACGSGNFLIIAYKELCKLEIETFKRLYGKQKSFKFKSSLSLDQFYGIEIDDFAHEVAKLSLVLAEHQMNLEFMEIFGETRPTLPLRTGGHIHCGNASRMDWEEICPIEERREIYVLGNPPYLGSRLQNDHHKDDLEHVVKTDFKNIDYVSCWLVKASEYIKGSNAAFAFVTTNSVCQGVQVELLWPRLLGDQLEISFAYTSFKWKNNARANAGVTVIIVGVRNKSNADKFLFSSGGIQTVKNINGYLASTKNIYIHRRSNPFSRKIPQMLYGALLNDGGHLVLSTVEKNALIDSHPAAHSWVKKYIGTREFLRGLERWCLYIPDHDLESARRIPEIDTRLDAVRAHRKGSSEKSTAALAGKPNKFYFSAHMNGDSILIPRTSSERRTYIPLGLFNSQTIIADAQAIYEPQLYIFAMISSRIHMTWVRAVAGRLKTDFRYSSALCYNTFPFPELTDRQKIELENHVFKVLEQRERHSEMTVSKLYDPKTMPAELHKAHIDMDSAVERCFRSRPFQSDDERLDYLFRLYEQLNTEGELKLETVSA